MNFDVIYNCKQNKSIDQMEVQIMKKVKFTKVRNKNIWKASTGAEIRYNIFFEQYDVQKATRFAFAKTLEEAKEIVETDRRFW